jgi:iron complex outermembrane receptor protein
MKKKMQLFILACLSTTVCAATGAATGGVPQDSVRNKTVDLDEVVVTGSRIPVSRDVIPVPVSIINRQTIEQSGESVLLPVLMQQVPGLFVTARGVAGYGVSGGSAGGINMRGFSAGSGQLLILIDGHPQYAPIYGHHVADAYIASDAQRVEVSRGAASILYGSNAMGGAINIITRQATEEGNRLSARAAGGSFGTQRYSLTDAYSNGRFTSVAGSHYERTDGHRANSSFDSWSGFARLGYRLTGAWTATAQANIVKAIGRTPGQASRPLLDGMTDVVRGVSGLSVENNFGKTRGAVNFYYNWGNHRINDGYYAGGYPQQYLFRSTDDMAGVNVYQAVSLFAGNTVTGGVDVKRYGGNAFRNPDTEIYASHIVMNEAAGYLLVRQELRRFLLEAGLRREHHSLYGAEWAPQAGVSFRAAERTHLKFSFSKGFRTPNMRELYMYAPANEDLLPERSFSYDLTLVQRLPDNRLSVELTGFHIRGDNLIEVVPVGESRMQNRNTGAFANKGVELSLHFRILDNLSLNSNFSYLDMEKPIIGAPRSKFYADLHFRPGKSGKFSFNAGLQAVDQLYLVTGENSRTTDFTLIHAQAAYRPMKWMEIFVKGDNLLGKSYETMNDYPMPGAIVTGGVALNL